MDMNNGLGDDTICHILSFLPTTEAALTSVLSKRWRNLFVLTPNLDLDDDHGGEDFIDFVDRVLAVSSSSGDLPRKRRISIKCRKSIKDDTGHVTRWMIDVLKHGVQNLYIDVIADDVVLVPLEIFTCKTLVELKLAKGFEAMIPGDDVFLPSLKTLCLHAVYFYNSGYCVLEKLVSGCPLLEELTIRSARWQSGNFCCIVSSWTLKKLTIEVRDAFDNWEISFDTPSLVYLEYSDVVPRAVPVVNLESLVEAKLGLHVRLMSSNPTNLIKGLRNVEVLEISSVRTWELKQMKQFVEKLSSLELVKVLAYATNDKKKSRITKDLLKIPRSSKCNIKIRF
ncbi:hypothetical protein EUTSA_v10017553mg, partial [Eutrema salsugineum]